MFLLAIKERFLYLIYESLSEFGFLVSSPSLYPYSKGFSSFFSSLILLFLAHLGYDYVIRMTKDELPPANAFWSFTLYDAVNGFFIPNEHKKYSVGENGGMKLNEKGGIEIYIAAEKPKGVPTENWLPIERKDLELNVILRVYAPDLEKMKTWEAPKAEMT